MSKSSEGNFNHIFTIIDNMVESTIESIEEDDETVSCAKGCTHCCYLLVEISWEEALELVNWLQTLAPERRDYFFRKIKSSAKEAREFFSSSDETKHFAAGWEYEQELPDDLYDSYFYGKSRPCPFLEEGKCAPYEVRPMPCRMHMVTSAPELCSRTIGDDEGYEIPEVVEELQEEAAPAIAAMAKDGRWGHLALMVEKVLLEQGLIEESIDDVSQAA